MIDTVAKWYSKGNLRIAWVRIPLSFSRDSSVWSEHYIKVVVKFEIDSKSIFSRVSDILNKNIRTGKSGMFSVVESTL